MQVRFLLSAPKPQRHMSLGLYFLTIHFSLLTKLAFVALEVIGNSE